MSPASDGRPGRAAVREPLLTNCSTRGMASFKVNVPTKANPTRKLIAIGIANARSRNSRSGRIGRRRTGWRPAIPRRPPHTAPARPGCGSGPAGPARRPPRPASAPPPSNACTWSPAPSARPDAAGPNGRCAGGRLSTPSRLFSKAVSFRPQRTNPVPGQYTQDRTVRGRCGRAGGIRCQATASATA
jgi:hypothetical protein